jgi:hypothetical protein
MARTIGASEDAAGPSQPAGCMAGDPPNQDQVPEPFTGAAPMPIRCICSTRSDFPVTNWELLCGLINQGAHLGVRKACRYSPSDDEDADCD